MESLFPCHYNGFFGYVLVMFQYVPTIILTIIFIITVIKPNPFYSNLGLTMKVCWVFGILLKYLIIPGTFNLPRYGPNKCEGLASLLLEYLESHFNIIIKSCPFPNPDILQMGSFIGYIFTFHILWTYPLNNLSLWGLLSAIFVPWSYSISDNSNVWITLGSFVTGYILGFFSILIFYYLFIINDISNNKE
jgi:hypothetical protein